MPSVKRSLFTLLVAPVLLGATLTGSASAARAHQPIALHATLQGRSLHIAGSNFAPGARVTIALINTHTWRILFRGSTTAEAATYTCPREANAICGQRDPNAGNLSFQATLQQGSSPTILAVLYRFGNEVGFGRVRTL